MLVIPAEASAETGDLKGFGGTRSPIGFSIGDRATIFLCPAGSLQHLIGLDHRIEAGFCTSIPTI